MTAREEGIMEKIRLKAIEILATTPDGVRYSELVRKIHEQLPEENEATIRGTIWDLDKRMPGEVDKPARGLFRHISFREEEIEEGEVPPHVEKVREEDFYKPFADWLVSEVEECSKAIPLGGNRFGGKWGTPDVIGIREPLRSDIVKFPIEIVTAEIKTNTRGLITAFGQACSYKLFSHKSYIVVPKESSEEDKSRLDSLSLICGIGLVLFDHSNPDDPQFEIRVRPLKREPDMFYVNEHMKVIKEELGW